MSLTPSTVDDPSEVSPEPPKRGRLATTFSALRYRDFRLVWIGAFVSTTGTWMQIVAQSWLVFSMTQSAFLLGLDAFLGTVPIILFSLFGGVAADRFDRRKMLITSQVLQMTFAFVLVALIVTGRIQVWHIFILSFLTGTAQSIGGPAYQALLPILVKREHIPNAIAMNSLQFNLARVIGPVLAGVALASYGAAVCFALNGLSFVAVIVTLLMVRGSMVPQNQSVRESFLTDLRAGFAFMEKNRTLIHLSLIGFASTFFGIPIVTMLPVVARDVFHLGAQGYSWILTASGAGSVCGALIVAASGHINRKGRLALWFQLTFAVFLIIFALSRQLWLSVLMVFFAGACLLGVVAMTSSLVQLATSDEMRGRVVSIFMLAFRGGMPLGNLTAGYMAEVFSVRMALGINAVALGAVALGFLIPRTKVKEL